MKELETARHATTVLYHNVYVVVETNSFTFIQVDEHFRYRYAIVLRREQVIKFIAAFLSRDQIANQ